MNMEKPSLTYSRYYASDQDLDFKSDMYLVKFFS